TLSHFFTLSLHDALPILILSSQSSIETRLPQDVLFQDGVLMFQNKKPLTFYMIYAGDEDLHIDIHFQAYCQVNLIEIRVLSSNRSEEHTSELQSRFDLVC